MKPNYFKAAEILSEEQVSVSFIFRHHIVEFVVVQYQLSLCKCGFWNAYWKLATRRNGENTNILHINLILRLPYTMQFCRSTRAGKPSNRHLLLKSEVVRKKRTCLA